MGNKQLYFLMIICVGCVNPETAEDKQANPYLEKFSSLVKIEEEEFLGENYVTWSLDTMLTKNSALKWVDDNVVMIDYYLRNALELDSTLMRNQIVSFERKEQEVKQAILADKTLGLWLKIAESQETQAPLSIDKRVIAGDSLMNIASKFFYMSDWNPHLVQMTSRFCEGINGQNRNAANEEKLIAAFCFQTLRNNMESIQTASSKFYYNSSMRPFRKLAEEYPDSVDAALMQDQLLTLRQEMYDVFARDSSLREVIFKTYEEQKEILPFALTQ